MLSSNCNINKKFPFEKILYCQFKETLDFFGWIFAILEFIRISFGFLVPNVENLVKLNAALCDADDDYEGPKLQALVKQIDCENFALNALNGFLIVLSGEGEVTYASENICEFLGLTQVSFCWCSLIFHKILLCFL